MKKFIKEYWHSEKVICRKDINNPFIKDALKIVFDTFLDVNQALVMKMCFLDHMTMKGISIKLGLTYEVVRGLKHKSIRLLRLPMPLLIIRGITLEAMGGED